MAVTFGSNIVSLGAQRQLGKTSESLSATFERLSSGMRINKASDDAAGLAVSLNLKNDTRLFTQAIRNLSDAISATSISQGALNELSSITQRQLELSEQSANGVYNLKQRSVMQKEVNALRDEYNRIVQSTSFNNIKLLNGSLISNGIQIQAGADGSINSVLSGTIGTELSRLVGDGTFAGASVTFYSGNTTANVIAADLNGDGKLDAVLGGNSGTKVVYGNGDGTFNAPLLITAATAGPFTAADVNNDNRLDLIVQGGTGPIIYINQGNGTFASGVTYTNSTGATGRNIRAADLNRDGNIDIIASSGGNSNAPISVLLGNGNGTFKAEQTYNAGQSAISISIGDINSDGILDIVSSGNGTASTSGMLQFLGRGDGTFSSAVTIEPVGGNTNTAEVTLADINNDGNLDIIGNNSFGFIKLGNGDGTFAAAITIRPNSQYSEYTLAQDVNGDGYKDLVSASIIVNSAVYVQIANGDGTFKAAFTSPVAGGPRQIALGDFNGDGVNDLISGGNGAIGTSGAEFYAGNVAGRSTLTPYQSILSQQDARDALTLFSGQLERITKELGSIGAIQSRFSVATNVLRVSSENYSNAASRILDVDVAEESAELIRKNILQQVAASILSQANQQPQLALRLLSS